MTPSSLFPESLLSDLGIVECGYTEEAEPRSYSHYIQWLTEGLATPLKYLSDERRLPRADLRNLYPEFQSALVFYFSYQAPKKWLVEHQQFKVAGYALGFEGTDYHFSVREKLETLSKYLEDKYPGLVSFKSLDAQPVLERDLAYRAGMGWFGKNSMMIHKREGSYFLIGSLLLNRKLDVTPLSIDTDHCGQCDACVTACPTNAINPETRTLIAEKCISTFTIEVTKDVSPPSGLQNSRGEIFGCDICQDVCPWNKKVLNRVIGSLKLRDNFEFLAQWLFEADFATLKEKIATTTNRSFKKIFFGTPFDRPGREGWRKNLKAYFKN